MKRRHFLIFALAAAITSAGCTIPEDQGNPACPGGFGTLVLKNNSNGNVNVSIEDQYHEGQSFALEAVSTQEIMLAVGTYAATATESQGALLASATVTVDCDTRSSFTVPPSPPSGNPPVVVATRQLSQDWGAGAWDSSSVTLPNVQAGDAIFVLGIYWVGSPSGAVAPSDSNGAFTAAVDQVPLVRNNGTPVFAQIFHELNAAAGTHVITPPRIGDGTADGTLYVVQARGLATLVATGQTRVEGTALPLVGVNLEQEAQAGDLVLAIGGYDNLAAFSDAGISDAPAGWLALGVQNDPAMNVPSETCYRIVSVPGAEALSWSWNDPTANIAVAAIAAFR